MVQVVYCSHSRGKPLGNGYENTAYFPNHKAAMIIMNMWNSNKWVYETKKVQDVGADDDLDKLHLDVEHYRHLWDT